MAQHIRILFTSARSFLLLLILAPAVASAQVPTGTIAGRVTDGQGRPIGAATVVVQSPALQGTQTTTTTTHGDYVFKLLPPGVYAVTVQSPGFSATKRTWNVAATEAVNGDVTLAPTFEEEVTVAADATTFVHTVEAATNVAQPLLELLPSSRDMKSAIGLAAAVHGTGPGGNFSISGAPSFESVFLVNGVQIQDNVQGHPLPLFIEDAIQETTVTTSGISAEYGRFSGGVVNTLTKSGGNLLSGSFRTSFRNDNWRSVSPFQESKLDKTVPTYEYTIGGPILRDRTWFFLAGRVEDEKTSRETGFTNLPFVFEQQERRFEFKATQALATGHRLQGAYTVTQRDQTNFAEPSALGVMDMRSLVSRQLPESLLAVHYTGAWRNNLFFESQYSARQFTFKNSGGTTRDRIFGTPLMDQMTGAYWWAPIYCGVCGDEERDNSAFVFKGTYFASTASTGSHSVVFGYDGFNDKVRVNRNQAASDWQVWTSGSIADGDTIYPVVTDDGSTWLINAPVLEPSQGTNFRTHALFVNDTWYLNRSWTFNLGLRYDRNDGRDASKRQVSTDGGLSPRLGLVWDPSGTGRTTINASFSRYAAALANSVGSLGSAAGSPATYAYAYVGDPINVGPGPYQTSDEALRQVFDWLDASGGATLFYADIPGIASRIDRSLKSPSSEEIVLGVSHQIGRNGAVRVDFVNRTFDNFYATRTDMSTGQVEDEFGQVFDLGLIENTNVLNRRYRGLHAQATYRAGTALLTGLSYSLSRLNGNANGETLATGPFSSGVLGYPEYRDVSWAFPEGDLAADQRHRARIWGTYHLPWLRQASDMTLGIVQTLESGSPYGAVGTVWIDHVSNPGYAQPPATQTYFFTGRDAFRTDAQVRTDLAFNIDRRLGSASGPSVFANVQLFNVFNQFQLFNLPGGAINTSVLTSFDDPSLADFDPFTQSPVEGVHWRKGDRFGQAIGRAAYTQPRTFRFSIGVKF